jgi:hypothetical protein
MGIQEINRRIDQWWDEQFATGDVDVKRAADIAAEELANDQEFSREYVRWAVRTIVYQRGIDMASRRRSLIREEGKAIARAKPAQPAKGYTYDPIVPLSPRSEALKAAQETVKEQEPIPEIGSIRPAITSPSEITMSWSDWMERDPETGHHVSILTFTKPKLLQKAQEIEDRMGRDAHTASFMRLAAGRLRDATTPMGDVLNGRELNQLIGNIEGKLSVSIGLTGVKGQLTWEKVLR